MADLPEFTGEHTVLQNRRADDIPRDIINFILTLGRALHTSGYAAHRLEGVLSLAARQLGITAQFFSTPTSIFIAFGQLDRQRTYLIRVEPGEQDLGKLSRLDRVILRVLRGELSPADGSAEIEKIVAAPPSYGPLITTLAFALTSGSAARFLGGGLREIAVGTLLGLVIGLLALVAHRYAAATRVFEPVASFAAALLATMISHAWPIAPFIATLAGLIVLVPGFSLTVAMVELSTRHLASGTARMSAAFMTFLGIIFGVGLGNALAGVLLGPMVSVQPLPTWPWVQVVALLVAPLGFVVLLKAERRDTPWFVAVGLVAFYGSRLGAHIFGPELGSFLGALGVGVASNLLSKWLDRPSQIFLVPGILLLVPGSVGMRSLAALMDREVVSGIETAFQMMVIAVSLVAGILISTVVTPRRRLPVGGPSGGEGRMQPGAEP